MSQPTESPGTLLPGTTAPTTAPALALAPTSNDVSQQIADLTEAVNRLVQAQQQPSRAQQEQPRRGPTLFTDIGGDLPGGAPLLPAVDVARLSPVQQIALGLRDARPVGPAHPAVLHATTRAAPSNENAPEAPPTGAD